MGTKREFKPEYIGEEILEEAYTIPSTNDWVNGIPEFFSGIVIIISIIMMFDGEFVSSYTDYI